MIEGGLLLLVIIIVLWVGRGGGILGRAWKREQERKKEQEKQKELENLIKCPYCAEKIQPEAKLCRYCQKDIPIKNST